MSVPVSPHLCCAVRSVAAWLTIFSLLSCSDPVADGVRPGDMPSVLTTRAQRQGLVEDGAEALCAQLGYTVIIRGTPGTDTLRGTSRNECILGFGGNDALYGGGGNDVILGGDGDDYLRGENGNDLVRGGPGQDNLDGGNGKDKLYGGDGDDHLYGSNGKDEVYGGPGADYIETNNAPDLVWGEDCHDVINSGLGQDKVDGNAGYDACDGDHCDAPEGSATGCTSNAMCPSGMRCVVSNGLCVPSTAQVCEDNPLIAPPPDAGMDGGFDAGPICAPVDTVDVTCDGIDDDCDGQVDEDFVSSATSCGVGACASTGVSACVGGQLSSSCSPGVPAASDTTCDSIDDDCDGQVDEQFASIVTSCGVGACSRQGMTSCVAGQPSDSCAPGAPALSDLSCDGQDDDCDGQVDEDFVSAATACGLGACSSTGSSSCGAGVLQDSCTPGTPAPIDATCNGLDDDCSGAVDEDFVSAATSCGVGACAGAGVTSCTNGLVADSCAPGNPSASDASCNGVDDNCNGEVDEGFVGTPTSCGAGACAATGVTRCVTGQVLNSCAPADPAVSDTTCDGIDDNCDGQVDEGYLSVPSTCGQGVCESSGVTSCVNGPLSDSCEADDPLDELDLDCNGDDDDCDGEIDEDFVSTEASCGAGVCAAVGVTRCEDAQIVSTCAPGSATGADDDCNGIDDNCNGQVDEGFVSTQTSCGVGACAATGATRCVGGSVVNTCTALAPAATDATCNGIDDNCNGQVDEGFASAPTTCGIGACSSHSILQCVNGQVSDSCQAGAAGPGDATCDGVDDDCDSSVDEDYAGQVTHCGVGACAVTGATQCVGGGELDSCVAGPAGGVDSDCDGIDDDCDGLPDDEFVPVATQCGQGVCANTGTQTCSSGTLLDSCTPFGPSAGSDLTCDGLDDDCDGSVDEDYASVATSCGLGACGAAGTTACVAGSELDSCQAGTPAAGDAVCNGVDDDCDGSVDEDYASVVTSCGAGACAASGVTACVSGEVSDSCAAGTAAASDVTCDGVDDDCDGQVDEEFAAATTTCGVGACAATGVTSCAAGTVANSCFAGTPAASDATCDGVDDDCDGSVDDNYAPVTTSCGVGACAASGATSCADGTVSDSCVAGTARASDTTCDGVDDNCDGQSDEGYVSAATSCGVGACTATGATACVAGSVVDSCSAGTPATIDATCDGVDDNCDGEIDEDFVGTASNCGAGVCSAIGVTSCEAGQVVSSCTPGNATGADDDCNGIDDNCNGQVDDGFVTTQTSWVQIGPCPSLEIA